MSNISRRPAVQRTEIGPILSTIVPEVLELATDVPVNDANGARFVNAYIKAGYRDMTDPIMLEALACELVIAIRSGRDEWQELHVDDARIEAFQKVVSRNNIGKRFTHYIDFLDVLDEGLRSGVIMPIRLIHLIEMFNSQHSAEDINSGEDDLVKNKFKRYLHAQWFDSILHKIAQGPNGSLGAGSTETKFTRDLSGPVYGVLEHLSLDTENGYDLAPSYHKVIIDSLAEARSDDRRGGDSREWRSSGGCPVRHARYKKVGEVAAAAFNREGLDMLALDTPMRTSAISQCREFVAGRVEKIFNELLPEL